MLSASSSNVKFEIGHVLFIDIVGYSKLSINDQHTAVEELNRIVRASEQFQRAEAAGDLSMALRRTHFNQAQIKGNSSAIL